MHTWLPRAHFFLNLTRTVQCLKPTSTCGKKKFHTINNKWWADVLLSSMYATFDWATSYPSSASSVYSNRAPSMFDSRYIEWASITISDQCPRSATFLNSCRTHNVPSQSTSNWPSRWMQTVTMTVTKYVYTARLRRTSNVLNASVCCTAYCLQVLSESFCANIWVCQIIWLRIPHWQASHRKSVFGTCTQLVMRNYQESLAGGSKMSLWCMTKSLNRNNF